MENALEQPPSRERAEQKPRRAWHHRNAQLLALALLLPTPALGQEAEPAPASTEYVEEDRAAFLERLQLVARSRPTETSWGHFTAQDGTSISIHTSVAGTEEAASVYVDLRETVRHALAGDQVVQCHTHPQRSAEEIAHPVPEGRPLPIDAPSGDDIETYLFRLSLLTRMAGTDEAAFSIMQRFQDCVMTANGGYWQLEAAELDLMRARVEAINAYSQQSFDEAVAILDARSKSPEFLELLGHLTPEKYKGEPIVNRVLQFVYIADTKSEGHGLSPELVRLIESIRERKSQLQGEPGFSQIGAYFTRFFDPTRTSEQSEADLTAYLSYVREEFGIKITWHPISSGQ